MGKMGNVRVLNVPTGQHYGGIGLGVLGQEMYLEPVPRWGDPLGSPAMLGVSETRTLISLLQRAVDILGAGAPNDIVGVIADGGPRGYYRIGIWIGANRIEVEIPNNESDRSVALNVAETRRFIALLEESLADIGGREGSEKCNRPKCNRPSG